MNAPILSSLKINLPTDKGRIETFVLSEPRAYPDKASGTFNRVAFSAAHVVADARAANDPWLDCAVDWEQTLRYREYLWDLNLGVAEAMDTAQRGMGLDWKTSLELITRAVKAGKAWEAKNGRPALIATMPMEDVSRAFEKGETQGFMKILIDKETRQFLGAALLGLNGDEIVHTILDQMYAKAPYTVMARAMLDRLWWVLPFQR